MENASKAAIHPLPPLSSPTLMSHWKWGGSRCFQTNGLFLHGNEREKGLSTPLLLFPILSPTRLPREKARRSSWINVNVDRCRWWWWLRDKVNYLYFDIKPWHGNTNNILQLFSGKQNLALLIKHNVTQDMLRSHKMLYFPFCGWYDVTSWSKYQLIIFQFPLYLWTGYGISFSFLCYLLWHYVNIICGHIKSWATLYTYCFGGWEGTWNSICVFLLTGTRGRVVTLCLFYSQCTLY